MQTEIYKDELNINKSIKQNINNHQNIELHYSLINKVNQLTYFKDCSYKYFGRKVIKLYFAVETLLCKNFCCALGVGSLMYIVRSLSFGSSDDIVSDFI